MTYIVTGHYGSGKTEFALNLALDLVQKNKRRVTIADLDVVNPFFRSRENAQRLKPLGIDIVGSAFENHVAQDVPALSFAFLSKIRDGQDVILDLAGDESGLRLLANCYEAIGEYEFFCVLNLFRPETNTVEKMVDFCTRVNSVSKLPLTGLVNNANLLSETKAEHVLEGQRAVLEVGERMGLLLEYTLVREDVYIKIAGQEVSRKVLVIDRPWNRVGWM